MRATANPPTVGAIADAVWDEIITTGHAISGSGGQRVGAIYNNTVSVMRRTDYAYGPTALANGASYIPAAGTLVLVAYLAAVILADLEFFYFLQADTSAAIDAFQQAFGDNEAYITGMMWCDGTNGFKNDEGAGHDLTLAGITL